MNLADHADHAWAQQGRCVYCKDCSERLYQGKLPARGRQKEYAAGVDKMLETARAEVEARVKKEWDERTPEQVAAYEQGAASYVSGESIMDRMRRGNPYKGTDLAKWFNMGWTSSESKYYEAQRA